MNAETFLVLFWACAATVALGSMLYFNRRGTKENDALRDENERLKKLTRETGSAYLHTLAMDLIDQAEIAHRAKVYLLDRWLAHTAATAEANALEHLKLHAPERTRTIGILTTSLEALVARAEEYDRLYEAERKEPFDDQPEAVPLPE